MTEQSEEPPVQTGAEERLSLPPDVPLDSDAKMLVRESAKEYATSIVLQAKLLAFKRKEAEVQTSDIDLAVKMVLDERNRRWKKDLAKVVGAGLFGMFVPGFITQLGNLNTTLTSLFTVVGVAGLLLVAWGLS
jgi:histone H3/H4